MAFCKSWIFTQVKTKQRFVALERLVKVLYLLRVEPIAPQIQTPQILVAADHPRKLPDREATKFIESKDELFQASDAARLVDLCFAEALRPPAFVIVRLPVSHNLDNDVDVSPA